jgi:hypothetical protein
MTPPEWTSLLREGALALIAVLSLRWNMAQARRIEALLAHQLTRERKASGTVATR